MLPDRSGLMRQNIDGNAKIKKIEQNSSGNCCQTVLPEMSVLKLVENAKVEKFK